MIKLILKLNKVYTHPTRANEKQKKIRNKEKSGPHLELYANNTLYSKVVNTQLPCLLAKGLNEQIV